MTLAFSGCLFTGRMEKFNWFVITEPIYANIAESIRWRIGDEGLDISMELK